MVQPILDKHCVSCHGDNKPAKGLNITEQQAWKTIIKGKLVSLSPRLGDGSITMPYQYGSHKSRLITQLLKEDGPCKARLSEEEWLRLVTWVDANVPNADRMLHKRTADGRNWDWGPYTWRAPWAQPEEVPAMGTHINLPDNAWRRTLLKQP